MSDKYTLRATDLGSPDDFVFRFNGRDVGRTYAMALRTGSIYGINLRGPLPSGVEVQGLADDLKAAKEGHSK